MGLSRSNHSPNIFYFHNQQSSLDNHQFDRKNAVRLLTHTGREVLPSGLLRVLGDPQSGGLRTPAEKCRPPG